MKAEADNGQGPEGRPNRAAERLENTVNTIE